MRFWAKDEYKRFFRAIIDKDQAFMDFEVLYWLGVRGCESLALTPADFDLKCGKASITKTYHRIGSEDVLTPPKTRKSSDFRVFDTLCEAMGCVECTAERSRRTKPQQLACPLPGASPARVQIQQVAHAVRCFHVLTSIATCLQLRAMRGNPRVPMSTHGLGQLNNAEIAEVCKNLRQLHNPESRLQIAVHQSTS